MKRLVPMLLFCIVSSAQTSDPLLDKVGRLDKITRLQFGVLVEYSYMQAELTQLHDKRVNKIINSHIVQIQEYVEQMKALEGK